MKKIPTLFQRSEDDRSRVAPIVNPECVWVLQGRGTATRKWDGTACMVKGGRLYKRYEIKAGKQPPLDFLPADAVDPVTGKQPGWVPVGNGPEDRWYREAIEEHAPLWDGTYELVGPKVQGNPEGLERHALLTHGNVQYLDAPRDFQHLQEYFATHDLEGIVWWEDINDPDCRKCKIKGRDFGIKRGRAVKEEVKA